MALFQSKLNDFLIICITFVLIYWFQQVDDDKRCKERANIYEKIKLPLLVSSIVGLILFWDNDRILSVFITTEDCSHADKFIKPADVIEPPKVELKQLPPVLSAGSEYKVSHPDFDIFTSLPEW
jgi:hypothetical protein